MNEACTTGGAADFDQLTPDVVIDAVESALGAPCTNVCRPLNSYINRVYETQRADGAAVIVKFYRPGRWSPDALQDEHDFLAELAAEEIPVVPPLAGPEGATLHRRGPLYYALFPKKGGRVLDEPAGAEWEELGRLIARVHIVGARRRPRDRVVADPRRLTAQQVEAILAAGVVPPDCAGAYECEARALIERIAPLFDGLETIRIHGDAHRQNVIRRPGEGLFLIDFDDMAVGPPVQDLWMFLPGRPAEARREAEALESGYSTFRDFDRRTWRLVEPLRAMRFVHFAAWCARQAADGGFARLAPGFGSSEYWRSEIRELRKQRTEIEDALSE